MYYIYFATSLKNGKNYVGYTSKSPSERVLEHNRSGNEWSKANKPLKLIYYEKYNCKEDALSREKFYKSGFGRIIKGIIIETLNKNIGE